MLTHFLRRASIRTKLMLGMGACLLLFVAVSSTLSVVMTGKGFRERVVARMPAVVGEIRNESCARSPCGWLPRWPSPKTPLLHAWEARRSWPIPAWKRGAPMRAEQEGQQGGNRILGLASERKYMDETGLSVHDGKGQPPATMDSRLLGQRQTLRRSAWTRIRRLDEIKLFINVRAEAGTASSAVAGLGLSVKVMADVVRALQGRRVRAFVSWCARMAA